MNCKTVRVSIEYDTETNLVMRYESGTIRSIFGAEQTKDRVTDISDTYQIRKRKHITTTDEQV